MQDILMNAGCYVAIILLGMVLRRTGFFKESDFSLLSRLVLRVTLPAALISSSAGNEVSPAMLTISLLGLGGGLLYIFVAWLLNLRRSREQRAFEILNTPGYNIGTFALPFTQSFLGPVGVVTTCLFDVGNVFICLGGAYSVAVCARDGGGLDLKRIAKNLLSSIPLMTHVIVVTMNLLHLTMPAPVLSLAKIVGSGNSFLAMLMIGVGFKLSGDLSQIGRIVKILTVRFGIAALLALAFYFLLPFDLEVRRTLAILSFSPIGAAVPGYTAELKGDVGLSSAVTSISIVCSIVFIVALLLIMM